MDMNALLASKTAERAAKGLIANNGTACATAAQRDYFNFRDEMMARDDWGNLPADLEEKLVNMKKSAQK